MIEYNTIENGLAKQERIMTYTVGVSMEPLLHNRKSTVILEKPKGSLQCGDVVLYHRPDGKYVLHRIIKVLDGYYHIRGDNCVVSEMVPKEWIIGVMVGFYEDDRDFYVACTDKDYQRYMRKLPWRYRCLCLKTLLKRIYNRVKRILKKAE